MKNSETQREILGQQVKPEILQIKNSINLILKILMESIVNGLG
jgi:hypothetical protein